jgi:outer membrane protein assembly factor BamA
VKASLQLEPDFHDSENTVAYEVAVHEGDIYKMGDVDLDGLDDKTAARMREEWTLREGEPYDSSYAQRFVKQAVAELSKDAQWSIAVNESVNEKDKTVDVSLHFSKFQ